MKVLLPLLFITSVCAQTIHFDVLGASPKGQYVAVEEYGLASDNKKSFSRIRIKNVWKRRYVRTIVEVNGSNEDLKSIRLEAKEKAKKSFERYNISS